MASDNIFLCLAQLPLGYLPGHLRLGRGMAEQALRQDDDAVEAAPVGHEPFGLHPSTPHSLLNEPVAASLAASLQH
jgi:hypothetical protein